MSCYDATHIVTISDRAYQEVISTNGPWTNAAGVAIERDNQNQALNRLVMQVGKQIFAPRLTAFWLDGTFLEKFAKPLSAFKDCVKLYRDIIGMHHYILSIDSLADEWKIARPIVEFTVALTNQQLQVAATLTVFKTIGESLKKVKLTEDDFSTVEYIFDIEDRRDEIAKVYFETKRTIGVENLTGKKALACRVGWKSLDFYILYDKTLGLLRSYHLLFDYQTGASNTKLAIENLKDLKRAQHCLDEVELLSKLKEHVVTPKYSCLQGVKLDDENRAIALEAEAQFLLVTEDLRTTISIFGVSSEALEVKRLCFEQLLQAVIEMHKLGFVHTNLKPHNIFVKEEGEHKRILIGRFDSSCRLNDREVLLRPLGSYQYRAPESLFEANDPARIRAVEKASDRIDVWSLGVLFYETFFAPNKSIDELVNNASPGIEKKNQSPYLLPRCHVLSKAVSQLAETDARYELLRGMLAIDPEKRLTALQALEQFKTIKWETIT